MTTPREILLKAADSIEAEPHRWIQGRHAAVIDGRTFACALELIKRGGDFDGEHIKSHARYRNAAIILGRDLETDTSGTEFLPASIIVAWNDAEGRTPEEVAAALRAAAESQQP